MSKELTGAQLAEWLERLHRLEGHSKEVQERLRELGEALALSRAAGRTAGRISELVNDVLRGVE